MKAFLSIILFLFTLPAFADDDFLARVKAFEAKTAKPCYDAPTIDKVLPLPKAPGARFLHDCSCPQLQCNCGAGGCHCAQNRIENRQPARWVHTSWGFGLYRGSRQIGAWDGNVFRPYDDDADLWGSPCKLPMPLPAQSAAPVVRRACST